MQLISLPYTYALSDLLEEHGHPVRGNGLEAAAQLTLTVRQGVQPTALQLLQSGKLSLAQPFHTPDTRVPSGTDVAFLCVWWTQDGMSGSLLRIEDTYILATDLPMLDGHSYVFDNQSSSARQAPLDGFMAGCLIACQDGPREVSSLRPGDMVWTRDLGCLPVETVHKRTTPAWGKTAPIVIKKNTLGVTHDLVLSLNQTVALREKSVEMYLGDSNAAARAEDIVNGDTVRHVNLGFVTFIVLGLGGPAWVEANGALVHLDGSPQFSYSQRPSGGMHLQLIEPDQAAVAGALL